MELSWSEYLTQLLAAEQRWVVQVFVVVFVTLLADLLLSSLLNRVHRRLKETRNRWDDALIGAARKPVRLAVWIVGLTYAADVIVRETGAALFAVSEPVRHVGVIVALTWFLTGLARRMQEQIMAEAATDHDRRIDPGTAEALGKLVRLSILITAALVILQTLGISIAGVLAFGGIGGIAIGFAAKDLLANFFGGLMIYLDRPFIVGDWIRSPDRALEGTVEYIGWRQTRIRTFDKRPLYVPNAVFTSVIVENPSRMSHRRIYENIGVRYDDLDQMNAICEDVRTLLLEHPEIDQAQTLMVNFVAFSASSCDFMVYTFTRTTVWAEYHRIKQEILLAIAGVIARHGAEIAYPTSTLHVPHGIRLQPAGEVA